MVPTGSAVLSRRHPSQPAESGQSVPQAATSLNDRPRQRLIGEKQAGAPAFRAQGLHVRSRGPRCDGSSGRPPDGTGPRTPHQRRGHGKHAGVGRHRTVETRGPCPGHPGIFPFFPRIGRKDVSDESTRPDEWSDRLAPLRAVPEVREIPRPKEGRSSSADQRCTSTKVLRQGVPDGTRACRTALVTKMTPIAVRGRTTRVARSERGVLAVARTSSARCRVDGTFGGAVAQRRHRRAGVRPRVAAERHYPRRQTDAMLVRSRRSKRRLEDAGGTAMDAEHSSDAVLEAGAAGPATEASGATNLPLPQQPGPAPRSSRSCPRPARCAISRPIRCPTS